MWSRKVLSSHVIFILFFILLSSILGKEKRNRVLLHVVASLGS